MKTVAIVQSNYIPWKGYFDLINAVDTFILYDSAQYSKGSWRNRNRIITPNGPQWLSIPVKTKGLLTQNICDTEVVGNHWAKKHLSTIQQCYSKSPYYNEIMPHIKKIYNLTRNKRLLSDINSTTLNILCALLEINTEIKNSMEFSLNSEDPTDKVVELCEAVDADIYLSGRAARAYLDENKFTAKGMQVLWMDYGPYPEYPQNTDSFVHEVSIIDLLMNVGLNDARDYVCAYAHKQEQT